MSSLQRELGQAQVLPGPKVSFASASRWGTEPEGWYVDRPYAVWAGVNYSPKVNFKLPASPHSVKPQKTLYPVPCQRITPHYEFVRLDIIDDAMYYHIPLGIEDTR
jgi:hypothetical protein